MAKKKITDLQLIAAVTDDINYAVDNGIQSYRATAAQVKSHVLAPGNVGTTQIADEAVTLQKLAMSLLGTLIPIGAALPYTGDTSPNANFILPIGQELDKVTYAEYFALVGTRFGQGNGSTTFNAPDWRGVFFRGNINIPAVAGSGSAATNNATFTAHGLRTGMRVRITAGALTGLTLNTDYFAIVIDANTLAFANSTANAYAGTKITISGTNTATVIQAIDRDSDSRLPMNKGGSSSGVGSMQYDAIRNITGAIAPATYQRLSGAKTGAFADSGSNVNESDCAFSSTQKSGMIFDASRVVPTGGDNRPVNTAINYLLRVL